MSCLRNALWICVAALFPLPLVAAPAAPALAGSTRDGVTLRLNIVTSPSLGSVTGAEIELRSLDAEGALLRAVSGPDGRAEFTALRPGRYRAVVRREGFGDAVAPQLQLDAGASVETRAVVLLSGGAPAGRVSDPAGRGLSGARVCVAPPVEAPAGRNAGEGAAFSPNLTQTETLCAVTAAGGSVALPRLPFGHYRISVEASGYGSIRGELTDFRAGSEPRAWVLSLAGSITGRVVDAEGQGVAGTKVTFRDRVRGTTVEATSAAGGVFRSSELAAGTWRVELEPAEHLGLMRDSVRVKAGETTDLGNLRARAAGALSGRLVGSDGTPVSGAEIRALAAGVPRRALRSTTTDERGRFRLAGLGNGTRLDLLVRPVPGFTAQTFPSVAVPAQDLVLTVRRSARITGTLKAEDGGVPARAYVSVFPAAGHPALEANAGLAAAASVDPASGAFTVVNVPAGGEVEVRAYAGGFADAATRVGAAEGTIGAPLELVLRRAENSLQGRVVDARGLPVAGASLGRAVSDEQGRFALDRAEIAAGKTVVMHADYASLVHECSNASGEETRVVLDAGGVVEGAVTDAEGQPLAGVKVSADAPGVAAISGVGGRYRLEHVPPGALWIRRQGLGVTGDAEGRKLTVVGGQAARADFRFGPVALAGTLSRAGLPLEGGAVTLEQPPDPAGGKAERSRFQAATADEEGRFILAGIEPGPARLTVNSGGQSLEFLIDVPESGATGVALDLPARMIDGVVLNEQGTPLRGAGVVSPLRAVVPPELAPKEASASSAQVWSRVTTGADGTFSLAVEDPALSSLAVCTCAQGCLEVPLDPAGEGERVTLWFDPRLRRLDGEER